MTELISPRSIELGLPAVRPPSMVLIHCAPLGLVAGRLRGRLGRSLVVSALLEPVARRLQAARARGSVFELLVLCSLAAGARFSSFVACIRALLGLVTRRPLCACCSGSLPTVSCLCAAGARCPPSVALALLALVVRRLPPARCWRLSPAVCRLHAIGTCRRYLQFACC